MNELPPILLPHASRVIPNIPSDILITIPNTFQGQINYHNY